MTRDATFWTEVVDLFDAVVDLDPVERATRLATQRASRPDVCAEVESLLTAHTDAGRFIEPVALRPDEVTVHAGPGLGAVVGAFRLIELVGAGGMGAVYRAQREDGTFNQQAAVKILSTPLAHGAAARRFQAERQILASLHHPHIVGLLDAGLTPDRYAFLVMEYVEGVSIVAYCRDRRLPLADRLRVFRGVCSAVHHAHRHSVVHRDLKPANILVTAEGVPKVLDFGIARLLDDPLSVAGTTGTGAGPGPLTLNYASPEQARGLPVTTSSDVYSLGVLLYELITGVRPYETTGRPLDDVLRTIVEVSPLRPSAAMPHDSAVPYGPAAVHGDLDAIVLRAMAKEPEQRYRSAEELADDLDRHLRGVPVTAREPSVAYVFKKLAARHRTAFVTAGVSLFAVVAALVVAVVQARVATAERRRADHRFGEVRQLANALIFKIHDAVAPLAGSTPVRQAIIAEALKYTEQLASESQGDAVLQLELARAYIRIGRVQGLPGQANLGDREGALASFRRAQALTEPLLRMPDPDGAIAGTYVEAARRVSETLQAIGGRRDEAIAEARKAVAAAERHLGPQPGDLAARSLIASASFTAALVTDWPDSLSHWQRAEGLYEALLAEQPGDEPTQRNVALVAKYLGSFYERSRDFATARRHYQRALALDEARLVRMPSDRLAQLDVAIDLGNVALTEWRDGNLDVAERRYAESLKIRKRLADSDPTDANARTRVAYVHVQLAELGVAAGRFAKAAGHANVAIDTYGPNPADATSRFEAARATWTLGKAQRGLGRTAAACAALESAVRAMRAVDERVRRARYLEGRDPLDDLVPETARCGTKGTETPSGRASARPPS